MGKGIRVNESHKKYNPTNLNYGDEDAHLNHLTNSLNLNMVHTNL